MITKNNLFKKSWEKARKLEIEKAETILKEIENEFLKMFNTVGASPRVKIVGPVLTPAQRFFIKNQISSADFDISFTVMSDENEIILVTFK